MLDVLVRLLISPERVLIALLLVFLLILVMVMLRKRVVTVPAITLVVAKQSYNHGEEVDVKGAVLLDVGPPPVPAPGETLTLDLKDSAGTEFSAVGTTQTGPDGTYTGAFNVPAAAASGQATLTATDAKLNVVASATFRLNMTPKNLLRIVSLERDELK